MTSAMEAREATAIVLTLLLSPAVLLDVFSSCSFLECHPKGICVESEVTGQGLRANCQCPPGFQGDGIRSCDPVEMDDMTSWSGDEEGIARGAFVYISSNLTSVEGQSQCKSGYFVDLWLPGCSLDDLCLALSQTSATDVVIPSNHTDPATHSAIRRIAQAERTIVDHVNRTAAYYAAEVVTAMLGVQDKLNQEIATVKLKGYRRSLRLGSSIRRRLAQGWDNTTDAVGRMRGELRSFSGATSSSLDLLRRRLELHSVRTSRSLADLQSEVKAIAANAGKVQSPKTGEFLQGGLLPNDTTAMLGELARSHSQQLGSHSQQLGNHSQQLGNHSQQLGSHSQQLQGLEGKVDSHSATSARQLQELRGRLEVHALTSRSYMKQVADAVFVHSNNVTSHVGRLETIVSQRAARARSEARSLRRQIKMAAQKAKADVVQMETELASLTIMVQTSSKMTEMLKDDFMRWTDVTRKEMTSQAASTDERLRVLENGMTLLLEQSESIQVLLESLRVDACAKRPCQNGGTCRDHLGIYLCVCSPGFTGYDCHLNIDECASNPCLNDATCEDGVAGYRCLCLPGWTGDLCETEVDECASAPCQHGGSCVDRVDGFSCLCPEGATGRLCETDVDECASQPCRNGGTCLDRFGGFSCVCPQLYTGTSCHVLTAHPSCHAHRQAGSVKSAIYPLDLEDGGDPFYVPCRMDPDGSSWVVIQRRQDGALDFYRGWDNYTEGFGNLSSEFWLGNKLLHRLTEAGFTILRVEITDWENARAHALYSNFRVANASDKFRLTLDRASYSGDAGNSMWDSNGERFTTYDGDHDTNPDGNCAVNRHGAWWYWNCGLSNLNGRYYRPPATSHPHHDGLIWFYWKRWYYSLKAATMLIKQP